MKCIVCKENLSELTSLSICEKSACKESVEEQAKLTERIDVFVEFWKGKTPNEENYKTYLEMVGLDRMYQQKAIVGEQPPKFSRRTWFTNNIIQSHYEWPDEFGRKRGE